MGEVVTIIVLLFVLAVMLVVILAVFKSFILIAREYERYVVFRLGRSIGAKGPGLIFLIPFLDTATKVDLREQFMDVPQQSAITKDNAPISVDFLTYWKVIDPVRSVLQVGNFAAASQGIATTTLRAVIGDITLDEMLAQRERINQTLRSKLDEVTERWGVKVTAVEIREIVPPRDVQDAMNRQMSAERTRRALVTEADGKREAAVAMAQGEKDAAILRSEGLKQSAILEAEGQKMAQSLRAEGFAAALQAVYASARDVDANTMTLQYMETLKVLGASPSTKYIFPMEFMSFANALSQFAGQSPPAKAGVQSGIAQAAALDVATTAPPAAPAAGNGKSMGV